MDSSRLVDVLIALGAASLVLGLLLLCVASWMYAAFSNGDWGTTPAPSARVALFLTAAATTLVAPPLLIWLAWVHDLWLTVSAQLALPFLILLWLDRRRNWRPRFLRRR